MLRTLYKTLVRPHLEFRYSSCVRPILQRNITTVEKVQRSATKITPSLRNRPYETRLQQLNISNIFNRQLSDIIQGMATDKTADPVGGGDIEWRDRWDNNRIGFHKDFHNPTLVKFLEEFIAGRQNCKILVPLCGKSIDMKWLADMGHTVIGIELVEKPIQDFFKEQDVEFDVLPVEGIPDAKLYKSKDGKLQLYKCSFFDVSRDMLGVFDRIFDRGALIALEYGDRQRYVDLITTLMKPDCNCLIEIVDYNPSKMKGPPFDVQHDVFEKLYGPHCNLKVLEKDVECLNERMQARGLDWLTSSSYMLTLK